MSMLFPSGEDANPLNRRLPAEVITRQRRPVKKPEEKPSEDVVVDLKTALSLKPDKRLTWLVRAFKMAEEGRASTTDLYDIISSRKFASGMPLKVARKVREHVNDNAEIFSDKQRRHLKSEEWIFNAKYSEKDERDGEIIAPLDQDDMELDAMAEDKAASTSAPSASSVPAKDPQAALSSTTASSTKERLSALMKDLESNEPRWSEAPAARGQEERMKREVLLAEERARRKAVEREDQDRWLAAEVEASSKKAREQQQAQKRRLEDEVDSSMMLLERLGQQKNFAEERGGKEDRKHTRDEKSGRKRGLSRSRSISVKAARSRSRRRRRRRRSSSEGPGERVDYADALARRLAEREKSDTTRIPVVDPGHAQKSWR